MKLVSIIFYPEPQPILLNRATFLSTLRFFITVTKDYASKKAPAGEAEAFVRLF